MLTPLPHALELALTVALFGAVVVLGVAGGMLVASGWRGKVLSWAPTCARCGFDLRASAAALPECCPECGRPLAGTVVAGPRRMHRGRFACGVALTVASAAIATGAALDAPRAVNRWILARRSLISFAPLLEAGDHRAWAVALDRVQHGRVTGQDIDTLLDIVLDRMRRGGAIGPNDRWILQALASSPHAPADVADRVYDTIASLAVSVRISASQGELAPGQVMAITANVNEWPTFPGRSLQVRIQEVVDVRGEPLPVSSALVSSAPAARYRATMNMTMVHAPKTPGSHEVVAVVEVRSVKASGAVGTAPGPLGTGAAAGTGRKESAAGGDGDGDGEAEAETLWSRTIEIPLRVEVAAERRR